MRFRFSVVVMVTHIVHRLLACLVDPQLAALGMGTYPSSQRSLDNTSYNTANENALLLEPITCSTSRTPDVGGVHSCSPALHDTSDDTKLEPLSPTGECDDNLMENLVSNYMQSDR